MTSRPAPAAAPGESGRVAQISVSAGGVPKRPIETARVTALGLEGDAHRRRGIHGGPARALCIFALEQIQGLQAEGHPIRPGDIGENLTLAGIDWRRVTPGARLALGARVVLEVTSFTAPCRTIARAFSDGDASRVSHARHPGSSRVYARVIEEGEVCQGDAVRLVPAEAVRLIECRP